MAWRLRLLDGGYNGRVPDARPLKGKIALVTGGTRGIGRACALKLGTLGAEVIVNYHRREADAERVVAELAEIGVAGSHLRADLGDLDEIHSLFASVKERHGGLDILINSAARGLERPRNAVNSLPNHLRQTFETNVLGPWFAAKEAAPLMEARGGGAIVNLTSLGAQRYLTNYAAVGVTKGALDTLTLYLAVELAPRGIRVNGVCPSWVEETSGVAALSPELGRKLLESTPAGRHITPDDVAGLVAFLCGPDAAMIIGQTIVIDGGISLVGLIGQ
jgi:enoyl-[acyl-carrier protein] reductase III